MTCLLLFRVFGTGLLAGSMATGSCAVSATQLAAFDDGFDLSTPRTFDPVDVAAQPFAHAQNAGLSLQQAQNLALQSPALQQLWWQRLQGAKANLVHSSQRLNPQLVVEQTGFKSTQEQESSIAIAQQLDIFGERKTRQQLAYLQLEQHQIRQLTDQAELKLKVAAAYWQLAQAEWALQLASTQQQLSMQSLNVAKKRLQAGRIAEVDYQRVHIAHQGQLRQGQAAQIRRQLARHQLGQLWWGSVNAPALDTIYTAQPLQLPTLALDVLQANLVQSLLWQRLGLQQQQASINLKLAKIQAKPQPTVSVGYVQTREPAVQDNSNQQRLALGLSIPLPLFQRNQGVIQAKQAVQHINHIHTERQQQQIQQQLQQYWQALQAIRQQYKILHNQQLPLSQQVQQKTLTGFEAGKFSVLEVQQASRDYQQLQAEQLDLLRQAWQLSIRLQALSLGLVDFDLSRFESDNFNTLPSQTVPNLVDGSMADMGINGE